MGSRGRVPQQLGTKKELVTLLYLGHPAVCTHLAATYFNFELCCSSHTSDVALSYLRPEVWPHYLHLSVPLARVFWLVWHRIFSWMLATSIAAAVRGKIDGVPLR